MIGVRLSGHVARVSLAASLCTATTSCAEHIVDQEGTNEEQAAIGDDIAGSVCPDAKAFSLYQGDWLLAKACSGLVSGATDAVTSKLTELAKGLAATTLNSFIPGLGSLFFGGGGGGDPFAAQADRIIDEIKAAKTEINGNVTYQVDDAVRRLQAWDTSVSMANFTSLSERLQSWNRQPFQKKVVDAGAVEIEQLHKEFTTVRNVFTNYILSVDPASSAQQPYSHVSMLHYYVLLVDLEFQVAASRHYWKGLNSEFVKDPARSEEAVLAAANASTLPATTAAEIAADARTLFDSASGLAQSLGAADAFFVNTTWGAPTRKPGVAEGKNRTFAVEEAVTYDQVTDPLGNNTWWDAGSVKVTWYGTEWYTFVGLGADRLCATRLFSRREMDEWAATNALPENQRPTYQYANFQTTDPWLGLFYHGPRPYCAPSASAVTPFPQDNPANAAALPRPVWGDLNILDAVDQTIAAHARQSREYANTVATGYTPVRVALDKWWRNVRAADPATPFARPYTALDAEHDRLLWSRSGPVVQAIGATPDISVGDIVDIFMQRSDTVAPRLEERSKFTGYVLQYGADKLFELMNADPAHKNRLILSMIYVDKYAGSGMTAQSFYATKAAEEWQPYIAWFGE